MIKIIMFLLFKKRYIQTNKKNKKTEWEQVEYDIYAKIVNFMNEWMS